MLDEALYAVDQGLPRLEEARRGLMPVSVGSPLGSPKLLRIASDWTSLVGKFSEHGLRRQYDLSRVTLYHSGVAPAIQDHRPFGQREEEERAADP